MRDEDRAGDADPHKHLMNELCLARGRSIGAAAEPFTPTMAWTVDEDHAIFSRQPITQSQPHVPEVVASSVQQDNWRRFGATKLDHMKPGALDLHETT